MNERMLMMTCCAVIAQASATPLFANEFPEGQDAAVLQAFEQLRNDLPQARISTEGIRISRVFGQPLSTGSSPSDSAEQFRNRHATIFGVDAGDLRPSGLLAGGPAGQPVMFNRETGEYKFTLYRYAHFEGEVPVFRSELRLLVRNLPGSPVVLASSSLRSLGGFSPNLAVARRKVDAGTIMPQMDQCSD